MNRSDLLKAYHNVRNVTEGLCKPLVTEDYVVQTMTDISPPKWHLGHTSWFFERVILQQFEKDYKPYNERYHYILNSYYQSLGDRTARDMRGTLSRPTVEDIYAYRAAVDERMHKLIETIQEKHYKEVAYLVELGLHHEQQHQELLVTDIKHILASNPLRPAYRDLNGKPRTAKASPGALPLAKFKSIEGGTFELGASEEGFAWDNERPRHKALVNDFSLMDRLVTCGDYLAFINDGGYKNPLLWLSDGWDTICLQVWEAPLYWEKVDGEWHIMTLSGLRSLDPSEPVSHVSFYEAKACARWADKRLPTEVEWERAAGLVKTPASCGNFLDDENFHPVVYGHAAGIDPSSLSQMFGDVWEWTESAYLPYPGYKQERGPLGEYNGKFMSNQMVLRGGSCATPRSHIRSSYRNFFQCDKRWQFTGIRLASDNV